MPHGGGGHGGGHGGRGGGFGGFRGGGPGGRPRGWFGGRPRGWWGGGGNGGGWFGGPICWGGGGGPRPWIGAAVVGTAVVAGAAGGYYVGSSQSQVRYSEVHVDAIQPSALPPQDGWRKYYVKVPEGVIPGMQFNVLLNNVEYTIVCPEGVRVGQTIVVNAPPPPMTSYHSPTEVNSCSAPYFDKHTTTTSSAISTTDATYYPPQIAQPIPSENNPQYVHVENYTSKSEPTYQLSNNSTVSGSESIWTLTESERMHFIELFERNGGSTTAPIGSQKVYEIIAQLTQLSPLPPHVVAKIWVMADADHDDALSAKEWVAAMALVKRVSAGQTLPSALPPSLA